jgi:hypothetical protein
MLLVLLNSRLTSDPLKPRCPLSSLPVLKVPSALPSDRGQSSDPKIRREHPRQSPFLSVLVPSFPSTLTTFKAIYCTCPILQDALLLRYVHHLTLSGLRLGVPKKVEEYIFLQIVDVEKFRVDLAKLVPFITSTRQVLDDLNAIAKSKQDAASEGRPSPLVPLLGVTVGLSSSGLTKV